jgi:hypothetical protein
MATIAEITGGLSIQGERQAREQLAIWADDSTVASWVADMDNEGILTCRGRGRHFYPAPTKKAPLHFTGITRDGRYLIRKLRCTVCKSVSRIEEWDVKHKGDKITHCEMVRSYAGDYADEYLLEKGNGRMKPRQIQGACATVGLQGKSYRALKKEAEENRVEELNRIVQFSSAPVGA